jgi:CBS-domain-containing membrane protein
MKVKNVMVSPAVCCRPDTNLGIAAEILWRHNCGILPITNFQDRVIGVVTDRDMFIALATRNRRAGELTLGEVTSGRVYSCKPDDDIHTAMAAMSEHGVRRLPVLDEVGKIVGIVSMDDVVRETQMGDRAQLSCRDVVHALQEICTPHSAPMKHAKLAA